MSFLLSELAKLTHHGHCCALVDAAGCLDPESARDVGVRLDRLLWVRCGVGIKNGRQGSRNCEPRHAQQNTGSYRTPVRQSLFEQPDMLDAHRLFGRQLSKCDQHREKPGEQQLYAKRNQELNKAQKNQRCCKQDGSRKQIDSVHLSVGKSNGWRSGEQELLHCKGQARRQSANINGRSDILEQAFKAADILVQNGGFEMIAVDLSNVEERQLRKVPLTTWFRFARVAEKTQTTLIFFTSYPAAHLCAALTLHMRMDTACWEKEIAARPGMPCAAEMLIPKTESFRSNLQSSGEEELERPGTLERSFSAELVQPNLSNEGKLRTNDVSQKETTFLHTQLLGGFSCELGIGQARKPVQQAQAKFTAKSMWK